MTLLLNDFREDRGIVFKLVMQAGTKLKAGLILNDVQQREITAKKPEFAGADIYVRDAWNRPGIRALPLTFANPLPVMLNRQAKC